MSMLYYINVVIIDVISCRYHASILMKYNFPIQQCNCYA